MTGLLAREQVPADVTYAKALYKRLEKMRDEVECDMHGLEADENKEKLESVIEWLEAAMQPVEEVLENLEGRA